MKYYVLTSIPYLMIIIISSLLSLNDIEMMIVGVVSGLAYFGLIVPKVRSFINDREDE